MHSSAFQLPLSTLTGLWPRRCPSGQPLTLKGQKITAPVAPPRGLAYCIQNSLEGGSVEAQTDILIVGAGSAGLVLAIELARRGVDLRLIEQRSGPFTGSRGKG